MILLVSTEYSCVSYVLLSISITQVCRWIILFFPTARDLPKEIELSKTCLKTIVTINRKPGIPNEIKIDLVLIWIRKLRNMGTYRSSSTERFNQAAMQKSVSVQRE